MMGVKVVYALVFGGDDLFYEMFLLSLCSLRHHDPHRAVEVVLDSDSYREIRRKDEALLEGVRLTEVGIPPGFDPLQRSRYIKTRLRDVVEGDFLYLDVDTVICGPLAGIDGFGAEIAAVSDENGPVALTDPEKEKRCRAAGFDGLKGKPFFNGGVFLVRDTAQAHRFFDAWHRRWTESLRNGIPQDQPALCQANLDCGSPIRELPGEWNCQVCTDVGAHYFPTATVLHYYATYGTFEDRIIREHIKNKGGTLDEVAADIAANARQKGRDFFHHSYKGVFTAPVSALLFALRSHPSLFAFCKAAISRLSRPVSAVLALKATISRHRILRRARPPFFSTFLKTRRTFESRRLKAARLRQERLGRGLVAMRTGTGIFLSWRMLLEEDTVYGVARKPEEYTLLRDGQPLVRLVGKTSWLDPDGTLESRYSVRAGTGEVCPEVQPFPSGSNWFDIPLERPAPGPAGPYTIGDVSAGDLDGDGEYELVVQWNSGARDNSEPGVTGSVLLDAYTLAGRHLWAAPIDLGPNIRAGAHYTQFLVYDFDRDGRSELMLKTAPGSRDATGRFVSEAGRDPAVRACDNTRDWRDARGMVLDGDEFLTVFRGADGAALDTVFYPNQRVDARIWGDDAGNRSERYTAAVAWLDGRRPYGFFMRGYYWGRKDPHQGRQCACAVSFDGRALRCRHSFDTFDLRTFRARGGSAGFTPEGAYKGVEGYRRGNEVFIGEGNHNCAVADVDADGRDEVLTGGLCYELRRGRLRVRWCSFLGHGDALHLGAGDPSCPGYVLLTTHETGREHPLVPGMRLDYGLSVLDAASGKVLYHAASPGDMGRGMLADVGAGGLYQFWGVSQVEGSDERIRTTPVVRTAEGFEAREIPGVSANFRIYWDGDLSDELLDGPAGGPLEITSWDGTRMVPLQRTDGCVSINGTKAVPCLQADLLGDWREELVMARADQRALRVFVSEIPTPYSMATLMLDPVYRAGIAAQQTGYNQPPHPGFRPDAGRFGRQR